MSFKTPLLRRIGIGIGVLSLAGLVISLRARERVADAIAIPANPTPAPTPSPQAMMGSLQVSSVFNAPKAVPSTPTKLTPPAPTKPVARTQRSAPPVQQRRPSPSRDVVGSPLVRVRIANDPSQLAIATSNQGAIVLPNGKTLAGLTPAKPYTISVGQQGLLLGNQALPNGVLLLPGDRGLVWVNGQWYRGQVRLIWHDGQLNAINEVGLESYLYGVVGAEMPPSWQPEALKAQAVAARSYALSLMESPANAYWDLGNDEAYQCYRGVETETNTTIAAVEATRGTILIQNNSILLSQYASTDEISQEAHGGIGKSMSQTGAQHLASRGATMPQILNYYYPQSGLGRIHLGQRS